MSLPEPFTFDQIVAMAGSHAQLLAACRQAIDALESGHEVGRDYQIDGPACLGALDRIRAAIAAAEAIHV